MILIEPFYHDDSIVHDLKVDLSEAERLVNSVSWFHRVEVIPGLIAPGHIPDSGSYNASAYIDSLKISDLANQIILELGTWTVRSPMNSNVEAAILSPRIFKIPIKPDIQRTTQGSWF